MLVSKKLKGKIFLKYYFIITSFLLLANSECYLLMFCSSIHIFPFSLFVSHYKRKNAFFFLLVVLLDVKSFEKYQTALRSTAYSGDKLAHVSILVYSSTKRIRNHSFLGG